ncbi:hypothetical protein PISMIDRAFT_686952 [Pisolithus microcarpus 441]|uniref:Uncharacterized protein n=1 Tax=Pisolithus microcarpus 441 TaxID=765257 RepID=A0A0C9YGM3_9AGAM|nr:hypothetical protein BKA83DRAFT_686952 [Pisolithus microcarpus]KIK15811.1 hypothetical protein PISMIDRAFT_686952 [Pisolithus microcarpus 441]
MSRVQRSCEKSALLQAASEGCASAVRDALGAGADINTSDSSGRTILTCALTADRWETINASDASFMSEDRLTVLRIALLHPDISLYTLNAPQESINDVTPLGMAAWLGVPQVVKLLLDYSAGAISVDGMDTDGATPLMYATREGSLEVVQQLLSHGARPDLRDRNHRSPIQFALPHPSILWACEHALRASRWSEFKNGNKKALCQPSCVDIDQLSPDASAFPMMYDPPPTAFSPECISLITDNIVRTVLTADLPMLYSLLFSPKSFEPSPLENGPVVVNVPDVEGWGAIHYCVSMPNPSIEMLDALYRAGADVSLFTTQEQFTPLHCFARLARVSDAPHSGSGLYGFALHLIRDLRAPLSARDKNEETCVHVAAEHGQCIDVLLAFLDCDTTGSIRNQKNSRGLTAYEVAKPQFRSAFRLDGPANRPQSSISDHTICPNSFNQLPSVTSLADWASPPVSREATGPASRLPADFDVTSTFERLLNNIQYLTTEAQFVPDHGGLDNLESAVAETSQLGGDILSHFLGQVHNVTQELRGMREDLKAADRLWSTASQEAEESLRARGNTRTLAYLFAHKRSLRGSEDSQTTSVEGETVEMKVLPRPKEANQDKYPSVAALTEVIPPKTIVTTAANGARAVPWPEWLDSFIVSADSSTYKMHLANLIEIERELLARDTMSSFEEKVPSKEPILRIFLKSRKRQEKVGRSSASKLKTWLKRKITTDKPLSFQLCYDLDDPNCAVGREAKQDPSSLGRSPTLTEAEREPYNISSILSVASKDLSNIEECLRGVEKLVTSVTFSIFRTDRLIRRTVKVREVMVQNLRSRCVPVYPDIFASSPDGSTPSAYFGPPNRNTSSSVDPSPPNSKNSSCISSAQSSSVSPAVMLHGNEDEDARMLRRLIQHKVNARINGAFDQIDRANVWLCIVKSVLQDLCAQTSASLSRPPSSSPPASFPLISRC